ncbi:MAG TPA: MlaD family protein [Pseudonocardiaceae bacterium]|nr:MlaD family protein [Pseudonocardiaceae bacterium]
MKRKSIAPALIKGGIFTLVTLLVTAVLGITIANTGLGDTTEYHAVFSDVTGLNVGDDIRIAGVRVGQVDQISVVDRRLADVRFAIQADHTLPAGVTAIVKYRNLVGQRYIELDQGVGAIDRTLPPGGRIPLADTQPALDLTELFNGFQPLFQALSPGDVNQLSNEIVQVLDGDGVTVDNLVANTASLTTTLAGKDQVIGRVIDNLNSVLNTVNSRGDELSNMVTTLQQLVSGLAQDRRPIGNAITALSGLTNATANLLQLSRPGLKQSISALGEVSSTLAHNTPLLNTFLHNLPIKYQKIATAASYGSWFNFFLCQATVTGVTVAPDGGSGIAPALGIPVTESRCKS